MVLIAQIALGVIIGLAQAAEPTGTLTLTCQGTSTIHVQALNDPPLKQEVSMGIIVDFTARTVVAPRLNSSLFDIPLMLDSVDEIQVYFSGQHWSHPNFISERIVGYMDRVTGNLEATYEQFERDKEIKETMFTEYSLKCKPTQRMF
jgi:hypothetical protein